MISVDWNYNAFAFARLGENMVTAVDALEQPAALLDETDKLFSRNLFHSTKRGQSLFTLSIPAPHRWRGISLVRHPPKAKVQWPRADWFSTPPGFPPGSRSPVVTELPPKIRLLPPDG